MSDQLLLIGSICRASLYFHDLDANHKNTTVGLKDGYTIGRAMISGIPEKVQKLEDTLQFRYEQLLNSNLDTVLLHRGGQAQEELRAMGAVAMTRGNDIYIRDEAYNEGFQFTDVVMLHELTHVAQIKDNKRIAYHEDIEEAEKEALLNEKIIDDYNDNDGYYIDIGGKMFYINNKIAHEAVQYAASELEGHLKWLAQTENLNELLKISSMLESRI
jgi:hypothetical protein